MSAATLRVGAGDRHLIGPRAGVLRRLVALLLWSTVTASAGAQPAVDADLLLGQGQVAEGDFERAVVTLGLAIERLRADETRRIELSRAHLFKAVALLGLDKPEKAQGHFRSASEFDKSLRLRDDQFSPRVIRAFEAARRATATRPAPTPPSP